MFSTISSQPYTGLEFGLEFSVVTSPVLNVTVSSTVSSFSSERRFPKELTIYALKVWYFVFIVYFNIKTRQKYQIEIQVKTSSSPLLTVLVLDLVLALQLGFTQHRTESNQGGRDLLSYFFGVADFWRNVFDDLFTTLHWLTVHCHWP